MGIIRYYIKEQTIGTITTSIYLAHIKKKKNLNDMELQTISEIYNINLAISKNILYKSIP